MTCAVRVGRFEPSKGRALAFFAAGLRAQNAVIGVTRGAIEKLSRDELLAFYEGKTAKWQIPDDVVFVDAIPLGATGKMLKHKLREMFREHRLPTL